MKNMNASDAAYAIIKEFEGLRLTKYLCPAGIPTIGYGHALKANEPFTEISEIQAEILLKRDVQWAVNAINQKVNVDLTQCEFDALVSFVYNIGAAAFVGSTVYKKLAIEDYQGAADAILLWDKDRENGELVESAGLLCRRNAERDLFLQD